MIVSRENDLRVVRTRREIKRAFLKLMGEREYGKITVQDITRAAGINRNTFYLHYLDKQDLIARLSGECVDRLEGELKKLPPPQSGEGREQWLRDFLNTAFRTAGEDLEFYRVMLENGYPEFDGGLKRTLGVKLRELLPDTKRTHIAVGIAVDGLLGSLWYWMSHPGEEAGDIVEVLTEFCAVLGDPERKWK